jgi:hypothetical protein
MAERFGCAATRYRDAQAESSLRPSPATGGAWPALIVPVRAEKRNDHHRADEREQKRQHDDGYDCRGHHWSPPILSNPVSPAGDIYPGPRRLTIRLRQSRGAPIARWSPLARAVAVAPVPLAGEGDAAVQQQEWVRGTAAPPLVDDAVRGALTESVTGRRLVVVQSVRADFWRTDHSAA